MKSKILKSVILIAVMGIATAASTFAEIKIRQQIDMQGNYITNLANPTKLDHAVPKGYADWMLDVSQSKLPKPGNQTGETGIPWPNPRFNDNGDGTVTDKLTGLMWTKNGNPYGKRTWNEAIDWCDAYVYAGHDDWRLPNVKELRSIVNYSQGNPSTWLNSSATPFTSVRSGHCWSSSSGAGYSDFAWNARLDRGYVYYLSKASSNYVWPVRSR